MMKIEESLRDIASGNRTGGIPVPFSATMLDAADEIERLKKALEKIVFNGTPEEKECGDIIARFALNPDGD